MFYVCLSWLPFGWALFAVFGAEQNCCYPCLVTAHNLFLGCTILRGPRPAAWDQEALCLQTTGFLVLTGVYLPFTLYTQWTFPLYVMTFHLWNTHFSLTDLHISTFHASSSYITRLPSPQFICTFQPTYTTYTHLHTMYYYYQTRQERHHNSFTPSLHLVPFCQLYTTCTKP